MNLEYNTARIVSYKKTQDTSLWDNFSLYAHFYAPQTPGVLENNKLVVDEIIKFEDFNENVKNFTQSRLELDCTKFTPKHSNRSKHKWNISDLTKENIVLINNMFCNGFAFLNYTAITIPPLT